MKKTFTCILLAFLCFGASAQVTWNFNTASPTGGVLANSTVSDISRGNNNGTTNTLINATSPSNNAGASGGNNAGVAAVIGAINTGTSAYFEFTITPSTGNQISVATISFGSRSTGTAPQLVSVRSSLDGFATDAGSAALANNSVWTLINPSIAIPVTGAVDVPVTIRLYGSAGTGLPGANTTNWRIDDLSVTYVVGVLAVSLSNFTGTLSGTNQAKLSWRSGSESSLSRYEIERSNDGTNYSVVGTVTANGNTGGSYTYTDNGIGRSVNLYRLKMVNNDGSFKYSDIVRVNNKADISTSLTVYPSPAASKVNTEFYAAQSTEATLIITDMMGKVVRKQTLKVLQGNNNIAVPVDNLVKGVYSISIISADGIDLKNRFIKN